MKISWHGYIGNNMSWSLVAQHMSRELLRQGHEVHLCSTNGVELIPDDLRPFLVSKESLHNDYDMQLSYTALKNFPFYLSHGSKNRFGMWCYEFNVLPNGFAKFYKSCDKVLTPSKFAKDIFIQNGIPESKIEVLQHGVDIEKFKNAKPMKLNTAKNVKLLLNVAQPHARKNLAGSLDAYGKAFTSKDDICLVLKVIQKKPSNSFDVDVSEIIGKFKSKYKDHAEILIKSNEFIPNIESLYAACDIVYSLPHSECFWLPGIEGLAAGKFILTNNYGGALDYLTNYNSSLVNGQLKLAPSNATYWGPAPPNTKMFYPDITDAVDKLRDCYKNIDKYRTNQKTDLSEYTWEHVVNKTLSLCK